MLEYTMQTIINLGETLLMFVDSGLSLGLWVLVGFLVYSVFRTMRSKKK
ncbi:MAG: hypothetical protein ACTSPI_03560 [Candidatus Heimdallarchaeaceae archaeon]